jgi:hypothetical protein
VFYPPNLRAIPVEADHPEEERDLFIRAFSRMFWVFDMWSIAEAKKQKPSQI